MYGDGIVIFMEHKVQLSPRIIIGRLGTLVALLIAALLLSPKTQQPFVPSATKVCFPPSLAVGLILQE